jgi:hypothetical protein
VLLGFVRWRQLNLFKRLHKPPLQQEARHLRRDEQMLLERMGAMPIDAEASSVGTLWAVKLASLPPPL